MALGPGRHSKGLTPALKAHNAQQAAKARDLEEKVWELRKGGLSFANIAKQLDESKGTVYGAYRRVLRDNREHVAEMVEDWVDLQTARLEETARFQFGVMRNVRPGGEPGFSTDERLTAARDLVRTGESLRKLLGLDAPEKHEHRGAITVAATNLHELSGEELEHEVDRLGAGLRTRQPDQIEAVVTPAREVPSRDLAGPDSETLSERDEQRAAEAAKEAERDRGLRNGGSEE